jgi:hypothetical protein
MDFGNTPRTQLVESFMKNFSKFNPDAIIQLETAEYNKVYEAVHTLIGYINIKHFLADKIEEAQTAKGGQAEVLVSHVCGVLESYLRENNSKTIIDHHLRTYIENDKVKFYIHPKDNEGATLDFEITSNDLKLLSDSRKSG